MVTVDASVSEAKGWIASNLTLLIFSSNFCCGVDSGGKTGLLFDSLFFLFRATTRPTASTKIPAAKANDQADHKNIFS